MDHYDSGDATGRGGGGGVSEGRRGGGYKNYTQSVKRNKTTDMT